MPPILFLSISAKLSEPKASTLRTQPPYSYSPPLPTTKPSITAQDDNIFMLLTGFCSLRCVRVAKVLIFKKLPTRDDGADSSFLRDFHLTLTPSIISATGCTSFRLLWVPVNSSFRHCCHAHNKPRAYNCLRSSFRIELLGHSA